MDKMPLDAAAGSTSQRLEIPASAWLIGSGATRLIAGALFLTVASFGLSAVLMQQLKTARDWVFHTREIQSKVDELAWDVLALQNGLRGYILTGDEAQLALRDRAGAELLPDIADLARLTRGDAVSQDDVDNLRNLAQQRLAQVDALVTIRRRDGLEAARGLDQSDSDAQLTAAITRLRQEEDRLLQEHLTRERQRSWLVFGGLSLSGALAVGLIALTAFLVNRTLALRDAVLNEQSALLFRKDLMMREIDHRVRNSLTLIYTLLTLNRRQASGNEALAVQLEDAAHRVLTVAKVHERLYKSETPDRVEVGSYIRELARDLVTSLANGDQSFVRVKAIAVTVPGETAIPLGLIVTELVTNALKYGRVSAQSPVVVSLDRVPDGLRLSVADHGPGVPEEFTPEASNGLGMRVVLMLVRQLGGHLNLDRSSAGARFVVIAPVEQ